MGLVFRVCAAYAVVMRIAPPCQLLPGSQAGLWVKIRRTSRFQVIRVFSCHFADVRSPTSQSPSGVAGRSNLLLGMKRHSHNPVCYHLSVSYRV